MKVLIVGDIHFRTRNPINRIDDIELDFRDKFYQLRKIIQDNNIQLVLQTGDIFDKARVSNETLLLAKELLESLEVPIIACIGNHDMISNAIENHINSSLNILEMLVSNLEVLMVSKTVYSIFDTDLTIHPRYYGNDNFKVDRGAGTNVVLAHSMVVNSQTMFDSIFVDHVKTTADLVICGHNHAKIDRNNVYNPGALVKLTVGKDDREREIEVGILDVDTVEIFKVLLQELPEEEMFNLENIIKKEDILKDSVIKSLNDNISNTASIVEILHELVGDNQDIVEELKKYIKV